MEFKKVKISELKFYPNNPRKKKKEKKKKIKRKNKKKRKGNSFNIYKNK